MEKLSLGWLILSVVFFLLDLLDDVDRISLIDLDLLEEADVLILADQGIDIQTQDSEQVGDHYHLRKLLKLID